MNLFKTYSSKLQALFFTALTLLILFKANAQNRTGTVIQGTVLAKEDGTPLTNATIKWNNGKRITTTNKHGSFSITLQDSTTILVASYIGYNNVELTIDHHNISTPLIIGLEKNTASLSDVVVNTGYQKLPKERATGSFTVLNKTQLNKKTDATVLGRMDGLTNSVLFDKNPNRPPITVRGFSTINGPKAPLIVVDNFAYEGDINNINPNDVESITILKDAAAASIWGTRAGNGVIVITTRKAKFNQPIKISFSTNVTAGAKPDLSYFKQMSAADFIDVEKYLYSNNFYNEWINDISKPALSPVEEILIKESAGTITHQDADAQINALKTIDVRKDFNKYIYQHAVDQQYNLNISAGSANMNYIISAGYDNSTDMLSSNYTRWNFRAANVFKPFKKLQVTSSIAYTQSKNTNGKPAYNTILIGSKKLYPYAQLADANGSALPLYTYRQTYLDTAGGGKLLDWKYYPLDDWKHNAVATGLQDVVLNVGAQYEIIHGLMAEVNYQYEKQQANTQNTADEQSFAARDLINRFSEIDNTTGTVNYIIPVGGILENNYNILAAHNARAQVNYNTRFNNQELVAIAGAEVKQLYAKSSNYRDYGYSANAGTLTRVDYVHQYPTFISGATDFIPYINSTGEQLNRYTSLFANAAYTYSSRYTVSASVRRDASNLFGVKANDKGVPLWSAGAAWNISHENFYHADILPYLNLRATYGFSGNVDNSTSAVTAFYALGADPHTGLPTSSVYKFPNPDLKWERVKTVNIGLDFELKNKVVTGSIDYYIKKGFDLFGLAPLDYTSGLGEDAIVKNVANMKGTGIDVELNTIVLNKKIQWFQTLNFSYNASKVTNYYLPNDQGTFYVSEGHTVTPLVGQPIYVISSYKWGGLEHSTGDPQGYLNSELSTDYTSIMGVSTKVSDLVVSGSAVPTFFGNFINTISYKKISLTVNFTYKLGYYFKRESINYDALFNNWQTHSDYTLRWQKPGDENNTTVPSMIYPYDQLSARSTFYATSSVLATKADHIRLQFLNLAYTITKSQLKKLPVESIECSVNANNLGIIWRANKFDIDPDYPDSQMLPPAANISLGLRIDF